MEGDPMTQVWSAQWICDQRFVELRPISVFHKELDKMMPFETHREDLVNQHTRFRKSFTLEGGICGPAFVDISADDYYKFYINGRYVGQGPAQSYANRYHLNRYEVTSFIRPGANIIAVHVYYNGTINRSFQSGDYRQGMTAELRVAGQTAIRSDGSWKCKPAEKFKAGGTVGYLTQFLENIDARLSEPWRELEFDDSEWPSVAVKADDDHTLVLQETPPVDVYRQKPVEIRKLAENHYIIDFGQELAGQFTMEAQGKSGQTIEIRCGEELEPDGEHVRFQMRCNCNYQEYWTLSGNRDVLDFYDYKAFRYVEVIGGEAPLEPDTFAAVVRHYPMDEYSCTFTSSHELLNRIWGICKNGVKYGTQEQFMDCPTREKGQYLGDNTIITHSHMLLSGDLRLTRKALRDFANTASSVCPGLLAVAPGSYMQEIADFSLQWPLQLLQYYKQSGDWEFVREMLPVADGIIVYFRRYERDDGLLCNVREKWNLVDWPANLRDGYDFDLTIPVADGCHNVMNAFYIGAIDAIAEIRALLGESEEGKEERSRRKNAYTRSFHKAGLFIDAEGSEHASLHANALPLYFELVPKESQESVIAFLKSKRLSCGVYMSYFLLNGLARACEYDYVFELLSSEDTQSWGNMVREGATTCFEAWGKDQKWNTSLCHPWASAPVPVLIEHIIGLKPERPGWDGVCFEPHVPEQLTSFELSLKVRTGVIRVLYEDGLFHLAGPEGKPNESEKP